MAVFIGGCGGGATAVPTVTVKPATEFDPGENGDDPPTPPITPGDEPKGEYGNLIGTFVYDGPVVTRASIATGVKPEDKAICVADKILSEKLIVNDGKLQNVFIYLPKAPRKGAKDIPIPEPINYDQKGCFFLSHATIVRAGQKISFLNSDGLSHNTNVITINNEPFNQNIGPNNGVEHNFTENETKPVLVKCDIHAWMTAFMLVQDHGYNAVSGADGKFQINDLPVGTHRFSIFHEGTVLNASFPVDIKPGDNDVGEIVFKAEAFN
ncbi:MAG: hypothetical protein CMJ78_08795 [Planctomycetaceae bacterium]|nr:hypothetical protein [Planctomycetaceae bacterium]